MTGAAAAFTPCVALLRGVNVGRGNRVPMAAWRDLLTAAGYQQVRTLLNSGNAVFTAFPAEESDLAAAIGRTLALHLGVMTPVIVKRAATLATILHENPFADTVEDPARLLVASAQEPLPADGLVEVAQRVVAGERFVVGTQAAYLLCPHGIRESRAAAALVGGRARILTTRNWATMLKLHDLVRATG